jgi:hypothetical protein
VDHDDYLLNHIKELYETKEFHDVILVSSDSKEYKTHKLFLSESSEYFKMFFTGNFKESFENKIDMECKSSILEIILEFVYDIPGKLSFLNLEFEKIFELIQFSDLYMLFELKNMALEYIRSVIDDLNYQLIYEYYCYYNLDDKEIKEACKKLIIKNFNGFFFLF